MWHRYSIATLSAALGRDDRDVEREAHSVQVATTCVEVLEPHPSPSNTTAADAISVSSRKCLLTEDLQPRVTSLEQLFSLSDFGVRRVSHFVLERRDYRSLIHLSLVASKRIQLSLPEECLKADRFE